MTDCIIIGGGLIGMLTARALRLRGLNVSILERGPFGREASWAGGGILSPLYPWRYADAVNRLASAGQSLYPELVQALQDKTGIDPEWQRCGLLALNISNLERALKWAEQWRAEVRPLGKTELKQLEPSLASAGGSVLHMPGVAQLRNPRLLKALQQDLQTAGVRMLTDADVISIETGKDSVSGVKTASGAFYASKTVVIANGAWSGKLLRQMNIDLQIRPIRGQMILLQAEADSLRHIVLSGGHYLIPRTDGRIVVGSTVEDVGFDTSTTDAALQELREFTKQIAPAFAGLPVIKHWAGLRPGCGQGIPYIGEHPEIQGLYVNAGHFRNGIVMAPAAAELLADLMTQKIPQIDPAPYALTNKRTLESA